MMFSPRGILNKKQIRQQSEALSNQKRDNYTMQQHKYSVEGQNLPRKKISTATVRIPLGTKYLEVKLNGNVVFTAKYDVIKAN